MNANAAVVVGLLVLASALVGVSSQAQSTGTTTQRGVDDGIDGDVSVFMQRGVVATNGSVDAGMWLAAFETAGNLSRKQALVRQRAATLDERIERLEARTERFPPANATSLVLRSQRARLVAERTALRNAVSEAETTAASEGVNATNLDELDRRLENVTVPTIGSAAVVPTPAEATPTHVATDTGSTTRTPVASRDGSVAPEDRRRTGATYSGP